MIYSRHFLTYAGFEGSHRVFSVWIAQRSSNIFQLSKAARGPTIRCIYFFLICGKAYWNSRQRPMYWIEAKRGKPWKQIRSSLFLCNCVPAFPIILICSHPTTLGTLSFSHVHILQLDAALKFAFQVCTVQVQEQIFLSKQMLNSLPSRGT